MHHSHAPPNLWCLGCNALTENTKVIALGPSVIRELVFQAYWILCIILSRFQLGLNSMDCTTCSYTVDPQPFGSSIAQRARIRSRPQSFWSERLALHPLERISRWRIRKSCTKSRQCVTCLIFFSLSQALYAPEVHATCNKARSYQITGKT